MLDIGYLCIICLLVSVTSIETFFNVNFLSRENAEALADFISERLGIKIINQTTSQQYSNTIGLSKRVVLTYSSYNLSNLISRPIILAFVNTSMLISLVSLLCVYKKHLRLEQICLLLLKQLKYAFIVFASADLLLLADVISMSDLKITIYLIRVIYNLKIIYVFFYFVLSMHLFEDALNKLFFLLACFGLISITIQILLFFAKSCISILFLSILFNFILLYSIMFIISVLLDLQ